MSSDRWARTDLSHEAMRRFDAIEKRLDELESGSSSPSSPLEPEDETEEEEV